MARELVAEGRGAGLLALAGGRPELVTAHHVADAARAGDSEAGVLLDVYADNIAVGLAALVNILDPQQIVVAGGVVAMGPLLFDRLPGAFARHVEGVEHRPPVPIVPATLGVRAGGIGAAVLARPLLGTPVS
jgi:glucokinase